MVNRKIQVIAAGRSWQVVICVKNNVTRVYLLLLLWFFVFFFFYSLRYVLSFCCYLVPVAKMFISLFFFLSLISFVNYYKTQEGAREVKEVFRDRFSKNIVCIFGKDSSKFISSTSSLFSDFYFVCVCETTAESPSSQVQEVLD